MAPDDANVDVIVWFVPPLFMDSTTVLFSVDGPLEETIVTVTSLSVAAIANFLNRLLATVFAALPIGPK